MAENEKLISISGTPPAKTAKARREPPHPNMVWIRGGEFLMGSDKHYPEEGPAHNVRVDGFWMDQYLVTNIDYGKFIADTGYVTVAERVPNAADYPGALPEMMVPGSTVFVKPKTRVDTRNAYNWWHWVPGADWRHPLGPDSSLKKRGNHPVVQLAFEDVQAYAKWVGKELPTEAEWEFAARGGLPGKEFAWGDEFAPNGKQMANTWQGEFPYQNLLLDGYEGTSPVGEFPVNGFNLVDIIGNVWEWTTDYYVNKHEVVHACCTVDNPRVVDASRSMDPAIPNVSIPRRVIKGGSHLCAPNYCYRYRPAARMAQAVDTGTNHLGFRLIVRPPKPPAA
jgi:formylglycine-generating enzyme required for sulfatase activity